MTTSAQAPDTAALAKARMKARKRRRSVIRRVRLATGLILFTYLSTHLINHAVGLISLEAVEAGRHWFLLLWRNPVASTLLYGALFIHFLLALYAIYWRRRLLTMPPAEAMQLLLGICVIPLLTEHALGTRVFADHFGVLDSYTYVLLAIWHFSPDKGIVQSIALLVAWVHGCIGLWFYTRLKPWYPRWHLLMFAGALLVPVLALLGFVSAGKEVDLLARDSDWLRRVMADLNLPGREAVLMLTDIKHAIWSVFAASLVLTLIARQVRFAIEGRHGRVHLTYPGGKVVEIVPGMSVLEASQLHGIPHASVCGGRGRCSTCRIRISQGVDELPPASAEEAAVLERISAPPNVRLACQLRPLHDIAVAPLLLPNAATARDGHRRADHHQGREREIAILFADLRGFTQLSERKLPYDVVFVLNRYFAAMGQAIERSGGQVDKFIGDGVMALFGIESGLRKGAQQALAATREMADSLRELNETLTHDLDRPLRIGIGIHTGTAIVGEMGYARAVSVTAIGDAVNTASRLEQLTKEFDAELVLSEDVATAAGIDLSQCPGHETMVRGRKGAIAIRVVAKVQDLPVLQEDRH